MGIDYWVECLVTCDNCAKWDSFSDQGRSGIKIKTKKKATELGWRFKDEEAICPECSSPNNVFYEFGYKAL